MNNFSKVGLFTGMLLSVGMFIRYFVIYSDTSQGLLYIFAGASIMAFSWLYEVTKKLEIKLNDLEEYIVDKEKKEDE